VNGLRDQVRLPSLRDWNVMFLFCVTMPALLFYRANDQRVLTALSGRTVREDVVTLPPASAAELRHNGGRGSAR
jgi:hypothetical protein